MPTPQNSKPIICFSVMFSLNKVTPIIKNKIFENNFILILVIVVLLSFSNLEKINVENIVNSENNTIEPIFDLDINNCTT